MRRSKEFRQTTSRGVRASRPTLVVHAVQVADGPRVGFVVGSDVGNAVTRNRVKRRLRHLAAARVSDSPADVALVVRALPRAATDPAQVPTDFGSAWHEVISRLTTPNLTKRGGR
jgi:ribonuclease P protein component